MHQIIDYRKFMLLLHITVNGEDSKVSRKVLMNQIVNNYPNCWYAETDEELKQYNNINFSKTEKSQGMAEEKRR